MSFVIFGSIEANRTIALKDTFNLLLEIRSSDHMSSSDILTAVIILERLYVEVHGGATTGHRGMFSLCNFGIL